jgi:nucleoid-associated protein YgaU
MQQVRTKSTLLKSNAPNVYVVKKGDTLWDISGISKQTLALA